MSTDSTYVCILSARSFDVSTLGHKVFEEKREVKPKKDQNIFYIKAARGADAQGERTSDGFVVYKGSVAADSTTSSMANSSLRLRQVLIDNGDLQLVEGNYVFTEDYIFSSPTTAAVIVMGRNANGLAEWKLADGRTLKEYEAL